MMLTTSPSSADRERAKQMEELIGFETKPLMESMLNRVLEEHFSQYL
jgi:hypothetical protein